MKWRGDPRVCFNKNYGVWRYITLLSLYHQLSFPYIIKDYPFLTPVRFVTKNYFKYKVVYISTKKKVHRRIYEAFCSIFSFSVVNGRIWFPLKSSSSVSSLSSSIWGIINLFKRCEKRKSISINRTFTYPILRFSPRFIKIPGLAPVNYYQPRSYKQENIDWYQLIFSCN